MTGVSTPALTHQEAWTPCVAGPISPGERARSCLPRSDHERYTPVGDAVIRPQEPSVLRGDRDIRGQGDSQSQDVFEIARELPPCPLCDEACTEACLACGQPRCSLPFLVTIGARGIGSSRAIEPTRRSSADVELPLLACSNDLLM